MMFPNRAKSELPFVFSKINNLAVNIIKAMFYDVLLDYSVMAG